MILVSFFLVLLFKNRLPEVTADASTFVTVTNQTHKVTHFLFFLAENIFSKV